MATSQLAFSVFVLVKVLSLGWALSAPDAPSNLLVEYLSSPALGIDVTSPRFSWTLDASQRGTTSTAFQVRRTIH